MASRAVSVVQSQRELSTSDVTALQERFNQMCSQEGVNGVLATEVGEPTQKILERAALTDLVVLRITYPPSTGIKMLTSQIRTLLARSSRPVLAVHRAASDLNRALLAFDGSPKAREALFVATYLAEQWQTELTILTGLDDSVSDSSVQDFAKNYLEFNEVEARFITARYSPETLKATAGEIDADLIIMGGYSGSILKEMTVGSSVNFVLRESELPILICR